MIYEPGKKNRLVIFIVTVMILLFTSASVLGFENKTNFNVSSTLSNSMGIGTFVSGYSKIPQLTSSLSLSPEYQLPAIGQLPPMSLYADASLGLWWLDSYYTSQAEVNNRFTLTDLSLGLSAPKIVDFKNINLSLSPYIESIFPLSKSSQSLNRYVGVSLGFSLAYKISDVTFSYSPSFSTWAYGNAAITAPCREAGSKNNLPPVINPQNIDFDLDQYLQQLTMEPSQVVNSNGLCQVAGRQSVGVLVNSAKIKWAKKGHTVSVGFGWYINFLRPLADRPDLRGEYASNQQFTEATLGKIAYSYKIPVDFDLSIGVGVISYQAMFSKQGKINFPFFDFVTPGKNQTEFYLNLTAGI